MNVKNLLRPVDTGCDEAQASLFFLWLEQASCSVKWAADPSGKFEEDHGNGKVTQ